MEEIAKIIDLIHCWYCLYCDYTGWHLGLGGIRKTVRSWIQRNSTGLPKLTRLFCLRIQHLPVPLALHFHCRYPTNQATEDLIVSDQTNGPAGGKTKVLGTPALGRGGSSYSGDDDDVGTVRTKTPLQIRCSAAPALLQIRCSGAAQIHASADQIQRLCSTSTPPE